MSRLHRHLYKLYRDVAGASAMELALALPVMIMLMIGFSDVTMAFARKTELQQVAQSGADIVVANIIEVPEDGEIKTELASMSGLPETAFTLTRWTECDKVPENAVVDCPSAMMERADYLKIEVKDTYQPVLGDLGVGFHLGPTDMTGSTIIRID